MPRGGIDAEHAGEGEGLLAAPPADDAAARYAAAKRVAQFLVAVISLASLLVVMLHVSLGVGTPLTSASVVDIANVGSHMDDGSHVDVEAAASSSVNATDGAVGERDDVLGRRGTPSETSGDGGDGNRAPAREGEEEDERAVSDEADPDNATDWVTPMYMTSIPGHDADDKGLTRNLKKLVAAHGVDAVKKNVRLIPGIDPVKWPQGLDRAAYGLKTVLERLGGDYLKPDFTLLDNLPWIKSINSRDRNGKLKAPWNGLLSRHVGSLFTHINHWQLSKDNGHNHTYLVESDGLNPSLLAIPVGAIGSVVHNAPKDYDIIIVNQPTFTGGKLFSRFADKDGATVEMYEWRQQGVVGLGAYLFSAKFVDKVFAHIAQHGADMFDAWLIDQMCSRDAVDKRGSFVGFDEETQRQNDAVAVKPVLRCYHAVGVQQVVDGKEPTPKVLPLGTPSGNAAVKIRRAKANKAGKGSDEAVGSSLGRNGALDARESHTGKVKGAEETRRKVASVKTEGAKGRSHVNE